MKENLKIIAILFFISILFWFIFENNNKEKELEKIKKEFLDYKEHAAQKMEDLNFEIKKLKDENNLIKKNLETVQNQLEKKEYENKKLEEELKQARQSLKNMEEEIAKKEIEFNKVKEEYLEMLQEINDSMNWFRENSFVEQNYKWNSDVLIERIKKDCVYKDRLNLGCIAYLMENTAISIKYKNDSQIGKTDFLQGIKQTIDRGGGDCEDYALFFKALLNTLKPKINATIELFRPNPGTNYIIYPLKREPDEGYWYWPDSIEYSSLKLNESYFYSICYLDNETEGHCVVGISKNKINSSKELELLKNSDLFEPQNGRYIGKIEKLDSGELVYCWQQQKNTNCRKIIIIISDKDIYYNKKGKYVGLEDYKNKILEYLK